MENYFHMIEADVAISGIRRFCEQQDEKLVSENLPILECVVAKSNSFEEALKRVSKLFGISCSIASIHFEKKEKYSKIVFDFQKNFSNNYDGHYVDTAMKNIYKLIKTSLYTPVKVKEVWMKTKAPTEDNEHHFIFNCPVRYNKPLTALILPTKDLSASTKHSIPPFFYLLKHYKNDLINKIDERNPLSKKIVVIVFDQMMGGDLKIDYIAKELGVSVRVLQRKLKDNNITFSEIVAKVRKVLAIKYLSEMEYSIEDIAGFLGFSEPSVFRKAFKKWTGFPPGKYRNFLKNK